MKRAHRHLTTVPTHGHGLAAWNCSVTVAWGDMDAFQHVNNVAYARYVESARVRYFMAIGWMANGGGYAETGPILKDLCIKYRRPVVFPAVLDLVTHVPMADLRPDRFCMFTAVKLGADIVADAKATVVSFDYVKGVPCPVPTRVLESIRQGESTLPTWVSAHVSKTWSSKV